jgi:hypothetical protein
VNSSGPYVLVERLLVVEDVDAAAGVGLGVIDEVLVTQTAEGRPRSSGTAVAKNEFEVVDSLHVRILRVVHLERDVQHLGNRHVKSGMSSHGCFWSRKPQGEGKRESKRKRVKERERERKRERE